MTHRKVLLSGCREFACRGTAWGQGLGRSSDTRTLLPTSGFQPTENPLGRLDKDLFMENDSKVGGRFTESELRKFHIGWSRICKRQIATPYSGRMRTYDKKNPNDARASICHSSTDGPASERRNLFERLDRTNAIQYEHQCVAHLEYWTEVLFKRRVTHDGHQQTIDSDLCH